MSARSARRERTDAFFLALELFVLIAAFRLRCSGIFHGNLPAVFIRHREGNLYLEWGRELLMYGRMGQADPIGHIILVALGEVTFGDLPFQHHLLTAFFGMLSIAVTYVLGRRWFSRAIGLLASAIMAISQLHILFSRWGEPQTPSIFFALFGILVFDTTIRRADNSCWPHILTGGLSGMVVVLHLSLGVFPLTVISLAILYALRALKREKESRGLWKVLLIGGSMALPMLGSEGIVRVSRLFLEDPSQLASPMGITFIDLWVYNQNMGGFHMPLPLYWLKILWQVEGAWLVWLVVAGWAYVATQLMKQQARGMWRGFAVITLVYSFTTLFTMGSGWREEYYVAGLLPAAVLTAAIVPGVLIRKGWEQSLRNGLERKSL